jgi:putative membrane protein
MVPAPLVPRAFPTLAYLSTTFLALGLLLFAWRRVGPRAGAAFALAVAFGLGVEWLGSRTGFPFGAYAYTAPGPTLLGVPLLVPLGWWAFTLLAFAAVPQRHAFWAAPLALVAWDLGLDPLMVRQGFWAFATTAPYYGVPWVNFLGWAACGALLLVAMRWVAPGLGRVRGPVVRAVFAGQAALMTIGLAWYGMPWAALATFAGMGAVMLSWRAREAGWVARQGPA